MPRYEVDGTNFDDGSVDTAKEETDVIFDDAKSLGRPSGEPLVIEIQKMNLSHTNMSQQTANEVKFQANSILKRDISIGNQKIKRVLLQHVPMVPATTSKWKYRQRLKMMLA